MRRLNSSQVRIPPLAAAVLVGFAVAASAPVQAATASTTFQVTSDVGPTCALTVPTLAFGTYAGAQLDATTTVSATCSVGISYTIGLNEGSTSGATVTTRRMKQGSSTLSYALYSDTARSVNWGNTAGVDTVAGTGTGTAQSFTVYGRIPASQYPSAASYADTITATLTY
jgi:spore coat protein U-like protein